MKQMLLVAGLSASLGAGFAVLFSRPEPAPRAQDRPPAVDVEALEAALVRALQRAPEAWPSPPPDTRDRAPASSDEAPAPTVVRRAADGALPPPDARALESISTEPESRRTWLFRSEGEVLAWLGTPEEVDGGGGSETWTYRIPPDRTWHLTLHRGRLISVSVYTNR